MSHSLRISERVMTHSVNEK